MKNISLSLIFFFIFNISFHLPVISFAANLDNQAPAISHNTTRKHKDAFKAITIGAAVSDSSEIKSVFLFFKRMGDIKDFKSIEMKQGDLDRYYGTIPAEEVHGEAIQYYIYAVDIKGNSTTYGHTGNPLAVGLLPSSQNNHTTKRDVTTIKHDPFYKKWWFYTASIVSIITIYSMTSDKSSNKNSDVTSVLIEVNIP